MIQHNPIDAEAPSSNGSCSRVQDSPRITHDEDDPEGRWSPPDKNLRLEVHPLSHKTGRCVIAVVRHDNGPAIATHTLPIFDDSARAKLAKQLAQEHGVVDAREKLEEIGVWMWSERY